MERLFLRFIYFIVPSITIKHSSNMKIRYYLFFTLLFPFTISFAQYNHNISDLKPGFNSQEADDLLKLNFSFLDTTANNQFIDYIPDYTFIYRSPSIGLDNKWDLWLRKYSTAVILLRGTTADPKSLLADFYCALIPAQGEIILPGKDTVKYFLAEDKRAAVHAGFLIGFSYLSRDIQPKLDSLYKKGYHKFLIAGHSQGGSLCYYVSAWLHYLQKNSTYPLLQIKTYASAPPKMGNMYYAYDYDNLTRSEWAFSVVNSADPVPEVPFTTQQIEVDVNEPNPFIELYKKMNGLPLLQRIALKRAFNKMRKGATKSSKAYQKYLGGYSLKFMQKMLPGIEMPDVINSTYFVRPGVQIVLKTNEAYYKFFENNDGPYYHHGIKPYRFLLREYYTGLTPLE